MRKGEITVFFSLILLTVMAFLCALIESARTQAVRLRLETAAFAGIMSPFAAFQKEMQSEYDVFFFDGAFGETQMSRQGMEGKLTEYLDYNLHPGKNLIGKYTDFLNLAQTDISLERLALATDDKGYVFREAAIDSMRRTYGISCAESLLEQYDWIKETDTKQKDYVQREQENDDSLLKFQEEKEQVDQEKKEEAETAAAQDNPADKVKEIKSLGILELVCKKPDEVSEKSMEGFLLPTNRENSSGTGLSCYRTDLLSDILYQIYLVKHFPNALTENVKTTNNLQYQLEYLIIGKLNDVDNLKGVVHRLLLLREGVNFAYLLTDTAKQAEAEAAAALLVGYTGIVPLITATKYALLLGWAYAESIQDVKSLLAGGKLALVKTAATWKTTLANPGVGNQADGSNQEAGGLTYKDYLRLLLYLTDRERVSMRALDIIERTVCQIQGNERIRMDQCVFYLKMSFQAETKSIFGYIAFLSRYGFGHKKEYDITKQFGYEMR